MTLATINFDRLYCSFNRFRLQYKQEIIPEQTKLRLKEKC